jgi:hypothetical protein
VTAAANAFTGTPAALQLVDAMRQAYDRVQAVDNVRTGDVFYCPAVTEGWDYVPHRNCHARARVVEEYDLSHGHIVRVVGKVTSRGLPTLRYVNSKRGWYRIAEGQACWRLLQLAFVNPLLVDFLFPNERLTIADRTRTTVVLEGYSAPAGYREIDYVTRRTQLEFRSDELTHVGHHSYRLIDHLREARRSSVTSAPAPVCS